MHYRIDAKYAVIVLTVLVALFFAVGASNFDEPQSNGRFQLVVRHAESSDVFVIDTATGQVWTNKYAAPDAAKGSLYKPKIPQE